VYFTDDSLVPENMQPTIITAAPFGPEWLPGDTDDLPVTWDQQVQAAVDCYNAGATMLHFHVRDPKTGQGSSNFDQYNELLGKVRNAVPKMIIQVGGSISFAPHTDGAKAAWLNYDTRHMLTELNPKPDFVTVTTGTTLWDITQAFIPGDDEGTHLADPKVAAAWSGMVVDSKPEFYIEHLKRLRKNGIQPYFPLAHVHQLEILERLIRKGVVFLAEKTERFEVEILEGTSVEVASRAAEALERSLALPKAAFTYLTSHGSLDQEHTKFYESLVNRLEDAGDRSAVIRCARRFYRLYGDIFRALDAARQPLEVAA